MGLRITSYWVEKPLRQRKGQARRVVGTLLYRPKHFCGIEKRFIAMPLTNEEQRLRGLYWTYLPEMEKSRVLTGVQTQGLIGFFKPHQKEL